MAKPVILITGANGQLGQEFHRLSARYEAFDFLFAGRAELPIEDEQKLLDYFREHQPSFCVNCAAYTAVDKAEQDKENAFRTNGKAVGSLAAVCASAGTNLVHISTDYVFNGRSPVPYKETDETSPVNTYGASKLEGERLCVQQNHQAIIIRTAWVYSEFGNNFVKTMMRLMKERESINVVNDQVGAPTYAADLAEAILQIFLSNKWVPGIYHYSNQGKISWYDFASAIREEIGSACQVKPIPSSQFPTPAKRPSFSLLDTQKIRDTFSIEIPEWRDSLRKCLAQLKVKG